MKTRDDPVQLAKIVVYRVARRPVSICIKENPVQQFRLEIDPPDFAAWNDLHRLLVDCFSYMEARIDPPSSLTRMTARTLQEKAKEETFIVIWAEDALVACGFFNELPDALYLGKLAVRNDMRGRGLLRRMTETAEQLATDKGKPTLELQVRIELTENHRTFAALGFVQTGTTAHAGYDRPTSITMRKFV